MQEAATRCGLDGAKTVLHVREPAIKARLRACTQAALESGVFGVPTLKVGAELFWGSDRVADAMRALQGDYQPIDRALLDHLLSLPSSAQR